MERVVEGIRSRRGPTDMVGCGGCRAYMINSRGTWPTRWVAGGIELTRCVFGGMGRTLGNNHEDPQVVRQKVISWSMPTGCGEIHDVIER